MKQEARSQKPEEGNDCQLPTADSKHFKAQLFKCADCGELFAWTSEQQRHYAANGFEPPKRCRPCRGKKRERFAHRPF